MATRITAQSIDGRRRHVVVPVRIGRAATGEPDPTAPDVDDRGHAMDRPTSWVPTVARGCSFGITVGETSRIGVTRVDLDDGVPLVVRLEVGSPHQVELVRPADGEFLLPDGIVELSGFVDHAARPGQKATVLEVRLGSAQGPVLAEAEPHTFTPITLNVAAHVCTLHPEAGPPGSGTTPTIGAGPLDLDRIFATVNAVYRPTGIRVRLAKRFQREYFDFNAEDTPWQAFRGRKGSEPDIVQPFFVSNHCNVYFVRFMDSSGGVAVRRDQLPLEGFQKPGIIIGVEGFRDPNRNDQVIAPVRGDERHRDVAETLAHEIGHFLELVHAGDVDAPGRPDTFARRQVMHPVAYPKFDPGDPRNRVRLLDGGYGTANVHLPNGKVEPRARKGHLLTFKKLPFYTQDGEVERARKRVRRPNHVLY